MGEFGIGQPVRRFEDKRLLSGNGHFQSDNNLHGQVYACVLRSPHAHVRIRKLDIVSAHAAPGVALIMTGDDLAEMAGRGFGKTCCGAEWVWAEVKAGRRRIALVAPTAADARNVMVEGASGILAFAIGYRGCRSAPG